MSKVDIHMGEEDSELTPPQPGTVFGVSENKSSSGGHSDITDNNEVKTNDSDETDKKLETTESVLTEDSSKTDEISVVKTDKDKKIEDESKESETDKKLIQDNNDSELEITKQDESDDFDEVDPKNWPEESQEDLTSASDDNSKEDEAETDIKSDHSEKYKASDEDNSHSTKIGEIEDTLSPSSENEAKPKRTKTVVTILIVLLLLLMGGSFLYYYLVFQPQTALANYASKFIDPNTVPKSFDYNFETKIKDSSSQVYSLSADGKFDFTNKNLELVSVNLNGTFGQSSNGKKPLTLDAETIFKNDGNTSSTFVNVHQPDFVGTLLPGILDNWVELPTKEAAGLALGNDHNCSPADQTKITNYTKQRLASLHFSETERASFFPQTIKGQLAAHYRGKLTGTELAKFAQDVDKKSQKICGSGAYSQDFYNELKEVSISYNLWTGKNIDRISLVVTRKDNFDMTLDFTTVGYGLPKDISEPKDAKPLKEITKDIEDSLSQADSETDSTTTPREINLETEVNNLDSQ